MAAIRTLAEEAVLWIDTDAKGGAAEMGFVDWIASDGNSARIESHGSVEAIRVAG